MATSIEITPSPAAQALTSALGAVAPGPPAATPTVGNDAKDGRPNLSFVVGSFLLVAVVAIISIATTTHFPYLSTPPTPVNGLTIFAVFFVAAQGIERLLEPIASYLGGSTQDALTAATGDAQSKVDAAHALAAKGAADPGFTAASGAAQTALDAAAAAKAKHGTDQANRTVAFWAVASSVGIAAAATLKLYLLTTVGVASPGRVLDVIATGLIIGAGTKPLHDLTGLITAKKDAQSAGG